MTHRERAQWRLLAFGIVLIAITAAVVPVSRAFHRLEITYNEGWNIYNSMTVAQHKPLYPVGYSFTSVNYPALSFIVNANLSRITHEYLYTVRVLALVSLLACCLLTGLIVLFLTRSHLAGLISAAICLALFCVFGDEYVGQADPQMFAQAFFMSGFALYVWKKGKDGYIFLTALLFVIGGNIKHNLLEFPLAVLVDLCLVSWRRATRFAAGGAAMVGISIYLTRRFSGEFFVAELLSPRQYSLDRMILVLQTVYLPLIGFLLIALYAVIRFWRIAEFRIISLLFVFGCVLGIGFSCGVGVWVNALFGSLLALAMMSGLCFVHSRELAPIMSEGTSRWCLGSVIVLTLLVPWLVVGHWNIPAELRNLQAEERQFRQDTLLLQQRPGPAICESLLRCNLAGKSYEYDPFNSNRLIALGRLDSRPLIKKIDNREFSAIDLDLTIEEEIALGKLNERFPPEVLSAIQQNYTEVASRRRFHLYVPKRGPR